MPQMLEVVEHGELHVGVDAVDESDAVIGEGEDDSSLFATPGGPSSWPVASSSSNLWPSQHRRWAPMRHGPSPGGGTCV